MQNYYLKKSQVLFVFFLLIGLLFIPLCNYPISSKKITDDYQINKEELCIISENNGTLSGFVKDPLMNPIQDALIRVHFHETYEEDYSDIDGYYHVTNIPICYCLKNCTCSKDGYITEWILMGITENTTHDFILYPLDPCPVINGSQCNEWWNSPINVSFIFDPEVVAEIWYFYNDWHHYKEPFIVDDEGEIDLIYYWIDYDDVKSPYISCSLDIDQTPPDIDVQWDVYKVKTKWFVKFIITSEDFISGMAPYFEFYLNDILQHTYNVNGPAFELEIEWNKELKNCVFGFVCSDNACNSVNEKVNGFEIKSLTIMRNINTENYLIQCLLKFLSFLQIPFYFL